MAYNRSSNLKKTSEKKNAKKKVAIFLDPDDQASKEEEVEVPDDIMSALEDFLF